MLIAALAKRLPDHDMTVPGAGQSTVSFQSRHLDIGDLRIVDDGGEFTAYIGDITHCHFEADDELESLELAQEQAVNDIVDFVEGVLTDQIEFYGGGMYGGSRLRGAKPRSWISRMLLGSKTYVWSGPVADDS